ncbi:MAG: hypothetical protein Kow0069_27630 [Promethearchaeota archaeon]
MSVKEGYFADPNRRNFALVSIALVAAVGTISASLVIRLALSDDARMAAVVAFFFAAGTTTGMALAAEIFFDLSMIEHVVAWSLPITFLFMALAALVARWVGSADLTLAAVLLLPWDLETLIVAWWLRDVGRRVDEHPYLLGGLVDRAPTLLPKAALVVAMVLWGLTILSFALLRLV